MGSEIVLGKGSLGKGSQKGLLWFYSCDSPDHLQGPKTAAETAGETRGARESAGGTAAETAGGLPLLWSREMAILPAGSAAVQPALPPAPQVSQAVSTAVYTGVSGYPGLGPCEWSGKWQFDSQKGKGLFLEVFLFPKGA